MRNFLFNNVNLNNLTGVTIRRIDPDPPDRETAGGSLVLADGSAIADQRIRKRIIRVSGHVSGSSFVNGQQNYDGLMRYLYGTEKAIEFDFAGARRVFTGTLATVVEEEAVGALKKFVLHFECADPFGYAKTYHIQSQDNITTQSGTMAVSINGNYPCLPIIIFDIDSISGGSAGTITLIMGGHSIIITRDWAASDVCVIDAEAQTVKVNDVEVAWSGVMPQIPVGSQTIYYQDTFTARNVDVVVKHRARYL